MGIIIPWDRVALASISNGSCIGVICEMAERYYQLASGLGP